MYKYGEAIGGQKGFFYFKKAVATCKDEERVLKRLIVYFIKTTA